MRIIFLGPPGSGKGTYSARFSTILNIPHVSTGEIFREEVKRNTQLGREVIGYMSRGELVPDRITVRVLKIRINKSDCEKGFILDGYPRTIDQARQLEKITSVDVVILLHLPEEILVEKLTARRVCKQCGEIYNIANIEKTLDGRNYRLPPMLPKIQGICDRCGGELIKRKDDTEEVIRNRLQIYKEQTEPLIDYYMDKNLIKDVYVTSDPEKVVSKTLSQLQCKARQI